MIGPAQNARRFGGASETDFVVEWNDSDHSVNLEYARELFAVEDLADRTQ